jgi:hypothetical protein
MPMADFAVLSADERLDLHKRFWRGELKRPLLGFFIPGGPNTGCPRVDIDTPPDRLLAKYRLLADWHNSLPGERVASARPDFGVPFLPALAGIPCEHDAHTTWSVPLGCRVEDLKVPCFDRELPLWRCFEEKLSLLVREGVPGAVITIGELIGPMDCLAAAVGPAQLCLDMVDTPEAVAGKAADFARLWRNAFDAQWEILREQGGTAGFRIYVPGRSALWSEDVLALVGPAQCGEFFDASIRAVASHLDIALLHTHSAALSCIERLAAIAELAAVEISNDPNGPPLEHLLAAGDRLHAAGKCVMFSNWNRPLGQEQVDLIFSRIDPCRTIVTFQVGDVGEALTIAGMADARFGRH